MSMKFHKHSWQLISSSGIASWDKQKGQDNAYYCEGQIEGCSACPALRLIPFDQRLQTVEVEAAA